LSVPILKVPPKVADNSISGQNLRRRYRKIMDYDQVRISFPVEPDHCILRLGGALGVASAEELRLTGLELCAYHKDVVVDWSGATQLDAGIAQVLLSLRAGLGEQNRSLACIAAIPPPVESWLRTAGLSGVLGEPGRGA
jgi:anti-anti-sigma regulatory factor